MAGHVKVSGVWKELGGIHVKISGVWKEVQTGYIKVAGAWKEFYSAVSWTLTGTSGTPTLQLYIALQPDIANVIWSISGAASGSATKGYMQYDGYDSGDAISYSNQHAFVTPLAGWGVIYVRLTADSGVADASSHTIDGTTWHTLTEDITNIWWRETHGGIVPESCVVKVEFCTVGDGSDIVATGYYKSTVSADL